MQDIETRIADLAVTTARAAGDVQNEHFGKELTVHETRERDVKLEVDVLCEQVICSAIQDAFPDHGIMAEEGGELAETDAEYRWIVDPLDGTVNYYHGLPYFCVSIACYRTDGDSGLVPGLGAPVVGVVYAPRTDELFVGSAGHGATLNGRLIRVTPVDELNQIVFSSGFGKDLERGREMARVSARASEHVRKVRCMGAAAYDISNIAAGRLGGFFEGALRTWDIAAAAIILEEAGGAMRVDEFEPTWWSVLASTPALITKLETALRDDR